jgi:hypothetical protein
MWRLNHMQPIFGDRPISVEVEDLPVGGGSGGSIFRARSNEAEHDLCLKTLPGVTSGYTRGLASFFQYLGDQEIGLRLKNNNNIQGQLRINLQAIRDYLPTHYAYAPIPGHGDQFCMCLLRLWCSGISVSEALVADEHLLNLDSRYRLEIVKQVCRVLIGLSFSGVVHLDCYPDNLLIQDTPSGPLVTLIDLEGAGFIPRNNQQDALWRHPTAFEKEDFWLIPWWYPSGESEKWLRDAAHWQLLMAILSVLTRTPSAVLTWTTPENFMSLYAIANSLRERRAVPNENETKEMLRLLEPTKGAVDDFLSDCFGDVALAEHLRAVISRGIIGPIRGESRPFLASADLREIQSKITNVRI